MKSGEGYRDNSRRSFIKAVTTVLLAAPLLQYCRDTALKALIKLTGTNHILGHRLWAKDFPEPSHTINIPYLIIGAGITGLSAARQLTKKGKEDFLVIEMEDHPGGNSSSGENKYSKFPLGAHYLPLPNQHDKELLQFLEEENIITGYKDGFPVFDEQQLTFSPHERLYYKHSWQEGLVPKYGNNSATDSEFERFFKSMEVFKEAKGFDGKYIFDIPLSIASVDEQYRELDNLTMQQWLVKNSFNAFEVQEYVNYCCRDDFGLGIEYVSAWAGIHYFAARKNNVAAGDKDNVLTWPEGNAHLATHLKKHAKDKILLNHIVFDITQSKEGVIVKAYDDTKKRSVAINAGKVLVCTPQFVNQYLIPQRKSVVKSFTYAPWLLATLTLRELPDDYSYPLCWDNVIFNGKGLGYIYDQHQELSQVQERKVITYYHSFSAADVKKARKSIYKTSKEEWEAFVVNDLSKAHPLIKEYIEEIQIHLLGHGMISPVPGFIFGEDKRKAAQPIADKIYFAHSDLSGISIFEEAFHQGINAVNTMLNEATMDT